MNNIIIDDSDKLLMSDSLQGVVPELEDQMKNYEDSIIIIGVEYSTDQLKDVIAGSLVGISFEPEVLKIDFRKSINECYQFFKICIENDRVTSAAIYLQNSGDESLIKGRFRIVSPKLTDLDHRENTCTISIDLVRIAE